MFSFLLTYFELGPYHMTLLPFLPQTTISTHH